MAAAISAELRARREKSRQPPVVPADRLWSRFRVEPQARREIGELAVEGAARTDLDEFRATMLKRRGKIAIATKPESFEEVGVLQRAEIQWQDRLANQGQLITAEETHFLGGWVKNYLAKEQQRVYARELSPGRFSSARASLFFFRDWAGAQIDVASISGPTLTRYHSQLLGDVCGGSVGRRAIVHSLALGPGRH